MKISTAISRSIPRIEKGKWGKMDKCLVCLAVGYDGSGWNHHCSQCPLGVLGIKLYPDECDDNDDCGCLPLCYRIDYENLRGDPGGEEYQSFTAEDRKKAKAHMTRLAAKLKKEGR